MFFKKWMLKMAAAGMVVVLSLTGCGKKNEENNNVTPTVTAGSAAEEGVEPTQTEAAKKLKQFADIEEGEVYAKINIEGYGTITVKFFPEEAPKAVENFITHAKEGYYDGVTFHRILDDFMIQGGDPTGTGAGGESIWGASFEDEFAEDLHPYRGALCMANAGSNTNGSQFFIVQADAAYIASMEEMLQAQYEVTLGEYIKMGYDTELTDEQVKNYETYGGTPWLYEHHTVFGQVMDGFDVLDAVAGVKTNSSGTPESPVVITSIEVIE